MKRAVVDLDGDGTKERISFKLFDFTVNGKVLSLCPGKDQPCGVPPEKCFTVIDIDTRDKQREIALHKGAGSITQEMGIFAMRKGRLTQVLSHSGGAVTTQGRGQLTISGCIPSLVPEYWSYSVHYVLTAKGTFNKKSQSFYPNTGPTPVKLKVKVALPLLAAPTGTKVAFTAKPGQVLVFEGCDEKHHCRVKTAGKQQGWFGVDGGMEIKLGAKTKRHDEVFEAL